MHRLEGLVPAPIFSLTEGLSQGLGPPLGDWAQLWSRGGAPHVCAEGAAASSLGLPSLTGAGSPIFAFKDAAVRFPY